MAGPPTGFEGFLNQKYDIQRQEANARTNLENTQAKLAPAESAAQIGVQRATANEANQRAATLDPLAQASIAATRAGVGETQARAGLFGTQARVQGLDLLSTPRVVADLLHGTLTNGNPAITGAAGAGTAGTGVGGSSGYTQSGNQLNFNTPVQQSDNYSSGVGSGIGLFGGTNPQPLEPDNSFHLAGGATKVPGKMPPKGQNTDVVPAMLTPGEAVLNKGAAEHVGRDKIAAMNQIGLAKMQAGKGKGMPPAKGKATSPMKEPVQQHAKGTSKVTPSAFYAKKGDVPLKPQTLAKGTHMVAPGKSAPTKAPPKGLANALRAMQAMSQQPSSGVPTMPTAPGGAPPGRGMS